MQLQAKEEHKTIILMHEGFLAGDQSPHEWGMSFRRCLGANGQNFGKDLFATPSYG